MLTVALSLSGMGCATEATFHGQYYYGHEVRSFHPCGSRKAYWVSADEEISRVLRDRAERLREQRGKPYQPVYVEVIGELDLETRREGFAEQYDGMFRLRRLLRVSDTVPKDCER
jgi:G:T-mismatch repair DNA endonuclease (very short patch repair protein)